MTKRTKLISAAAALALAAALAACGASSGSTASSAPASAAPSAAASSSLPVSAEEDNGASLDSAFDTLLAANPISNPFEIAAMNIEYDFGLAPEDLVSYKGVRSNDNGDAGLVLVLQPAEGRAEAVCEALESYRTDQIAFYGNYAEFAQAQANVEGAIIKGSDSLVVMVIASNECEGDLSAAVDSVL